MGSGAVTANLNKVVDSRCPLNAFCLVAGNVEVSVSLTDTGDTQAVSLCLGCDRKVTRDSVALVLNKQNYWLRLLAVNPYPGSSSTPAQPSTATLRLRAY